MEALTRVVPIRAVRIPVPAFLPVLHHRLPHHLAAVAVVLAAAGPVAVGNSFPGMMDTRIRT